MTIHGEIPPPPKTNCSGTGLILYAVILFSLYPFLDQALPRLALLAALGAGCAFFVSNNTQPLHLSLFTFFFLASRALQPLYTHGTFIWRWPFALLIPLLLYLAVLLTVRPLRRSLLWLRTGHIDRRTIVLMAGIAVLAAVALYLWVALAAPDLSHHLKNIPPMPVLLLPVAGIGFSLANAFLEEFVFRGIIMQSLDAAFGPRTLSVLLQAWLFGAMHFLRGFPNGWCGLLLATLYGLLLGLLRRRTRGLAAPFYTHAAADLIIFIILASRLSLA